MRSRRTNFSWRTRRLITRMRRRMIYNRKETISLSDDRRLQSGIYIDPPVMHGILICKDGWLKSSILLPNTYA